MADAINISFRFYLNHAGAEGTEINNRNYNRKHNKQARYVATKVALRFSEDKFKILAGRVEQQIQKDMLAEIQNFARQYARYVTGAPENAGPPANITTVIDGLRSQKFGATWVPRKGKYLDRKYREFKHKRWFDRGEKGQGSKGGLARPSIKNAGYMRKVLANPQSWTGFFGPVAVRVTRKSSVSAGSIPSGSAYANTPFASHGRDKIRIGLADIDIDAFENITPQMLTGDGSLADYVGSLNPALGYRLGGGSAYRPTLEPFLEFALTRSFPQALRNRLSKGMLIKQTHDVGN